MTRVADLERVDDIQGLVHRRVVVGPLATNTWIVATVDTHEAIVVDPGDEPERLIAAASDLTVKGVVLTHAHWDHVLGLPAVLDAWGCDVFAHPDDAPVWPHEQSYVHEHGHYDAGTATAELLACGCTLAPPAGAPAWSGRSRPLGHGQVVRLGDHALVALHTPGHTPGGLSLRSGRHVFTGDTLFPGGPGLTGWPLSDFPTIIDSLRTRLFTLPDDTEVHPGHGRSTTIGAERPHLPAWIERGW
jgi:hydroxyacylglutathione hydrolase